MVERHILDGDPPIELELRRNARARRLTLRVAARDGRVKLTVPRGVSSGQALAFAYEKQPWIKQQLAQLTPSAPLKLGDCLPIEGVDRQLAQAQVRSPRLEGGTLFIPKRAAAAPSRSVTAFLKVLARERLADASDQYAQQIGRSYARLSLRDTRTRWGSCSSSGALMYSWRLAMAPPEVLRYVAAHEVAHLEEMNHSRAFWSLVETLMPQYAQHRLWLRQRGTALQRIVLD